MRRLPDRRRRGGCADPQLVCPTRRRSRRHTSMPPCPAAVSLPTSGQPCDNHRVRAQVGVEARDPCRARQSSTVPCTGKRPRGKAPPPACMSTAAAPPKPSWPQRRQLPLHARQPARAGSDLVPKLLQLQRALPQLQLQLPLQRLGLQARQHVSSGTRVDAKRACAFPCTNTRTRARHCSPGRALFMARRSAPLLAPPTREPAHIVGSLDDGPAKRFLHRGREPEALPGLVTSRFHPELGAGDATPKCVVCCSMCVGKHSTAMQSAVYK